MEKISSDASPLETKSVTGLMFKYAIPATVGFLVSSLYNIVDQIFIGQGVGMLGNAATNVAFPLSMVCTSIFLLIGIGSVSNFSLNMGAGNHEKAAHIIGTGVTLLGIAGILLAVLVLLFLEPLMKAFGASGEVLPLALTYTGITALGFPFLIFASGASHLIRADGSPMYSMGCILSGAIVNTILDPIFIFGLKMGIAGAAIATVIGQAVSFLMVIKYLMNFKTVRIKKYLRPQWKYFLNITALGVAASFNQLAMAMSQIVMNNTLTHYGQISDYGQDIPLACVGVITKVNFLLLSFTIGIAQGCQPILGFNYGAKNYSRVKKTLKTELITVTCISAVAFICFQIFPRQIVGIFGSGSELYYRFAERYFRVFMFMTFISGMIPICANFFTSIGKASRGIFLTLTRQVIFLIPLVLILPTFFGIDGVMYAGPVSDFAAVVLTGILIFVEVRSWAMKVKPELVAYRQ